MHIDTLWIQPKYNGRESIKGMVGAKQLGYHVGWGSNPDITRSAPIGSVEYCESWLNYLPKPDFAPIWLKDWFHRTIRIQQLKIADTDVFVKSAEKYKEFPAKIIKQWELLPDGLLFLSEIVEFTQEWRYYVADGTVLATGWYDGNNEDEEAPNLNINWTDGWCGAADFGRLSTGEIALVECHHGYACGWYGEDHAAYAMWVIECWEDMKKSNQI